MNLVFVWKHRELWIELWASVAPYFIRKPKPWKNIFQLGDYSSAGQRIQLEDFNPATEIIHDDEIILAVVVAEIHSQLFSMVYWVKGMLSSVLLVISFCWLGKTRNIAPNLWELFQFMATKLIFLPIHGISLGWDVLNCELFLELFSSSVLELLFFFCTLIFHHLSLTYHLHGHVTLLSDLFQLDFLCSSTIDNILFSLSFCCASAIRSSWVFLIGRFPHIPATYVKLSLLHPRPCSPSLIWLLLVLWKGYPRQPYIFQAYNLLFRCMYLMSGINNRWHLIGVSSNCILFIIGTSGL